MARISKRLQVQKLLTALLEGTDWGTGMAGKVYRGRKYLSDGGDMLSLLESPKPDFAPEVAGENKVKKDTLWTLLCQGFTPDDPINPTDNAYEMMAATELQLSRLISCGNNGNPLFPEDYLLGKLITGISIGPGVVRPPDKEVSNTAYFFIPLVVNFTSDSSKPYVEA